MRGYVNDKHRIFPILLVFQTCKIPNYKQSMSHYLTGLHRNVGSLHCLRQTLAKKHQQSTRFFNRHDSSTSNDGYYNFGLVSLSIDTRHKVN